MMMTSGKGGPAAAPSPKPTSSQAAISQSQSQIQERHQNHIECCMCGDFGLTSELFRCKLCKFRSQHRYCSNIYPKAESYSVCNWCLNEKEDAREKTQNSSTSNKNPASASDQDDEKMIKIRKKSNNINIVGATNGNSNVQGSNNNNNMKGSEKGRLKVDVNSHSIKKQKSPSPERSPLLAARKRITTATGTGRIMQENLRRTKSDVPKGVVQKHVFRNKVRRYKLLDEVSS